MFSSRFQQSKMPPALRDMCSELLTWLTAPDTGCCAVAEHEQQACEYMDADHTIISHSLQSASSG